MHKLEIEHGLQNMRGTQHNDTERKEISPNREKKMPIISGGRSPQ